jgi:hypothetical protein
MKRLVPDGTSQKHHTKGLLTEPPDGLVKGLTPTHCDEAATGANFVRVSARQSKSHLLVPPRDSPHMNFLIPRRA